MLLESVVDTKAVRIFGTKLSERKRVQASHSPLQAFVNSEVVAVAPKAQQRFSQTHRLRGLKIQFRVSQGGCVCETNPCTIEGSVNC